MAETDGRYAPTQGSLQAALSNAVVRLTREYTGRGPTQAKAAISGNLVTVLMQDTLTKAEQRLSADGKGDLVRQIRREFQSTMRGDLVGAVEMLTERTVIAFMSDNHIEPDMAIEAFVLDTPITNNSVASDGAHA